MGAIIQTPMTRPEQLSCMYGSFIYNAGYLPKLSSLFGADILPRPLSLESLSTYHGPFYTITRASTHQRDLDVNELRQLHLPTLPYPPWPRTIHYTNE